MTEGERAMWTELSSAARAPIPKETIEFERTVKAANKPDALVDPVSLGEWEAKHNDEAKEAFAPKATLKLSEIDKLRAELQERGIKFAYNSKLGTLQKKLADADNPE